MLMVAITGHLGLNDSHMVDGGIQDKWNSMGEVNSNTYVVTWARRHYDSFALKLMML